MDLLQGGGVNGGEQMGWGGDGIFHGKVKKY